MIRNEIKARAVPNLFLFEDGTAVTKENAEKRKQELLSILLREEYGSFPEDPVTVHGEIAELDDRRCCAGKAIYKKIDLSFDINGKQFCFPFRMVLPKAVKAPPFAVIINFRPNLPDDYIPMEELIDRGIGFAAFCYKDVTSDDGDFSNGLARLIYPDGKRGEHDCGKLVMWSYAASRILDYVLENESVDRERCFVAGHSRLGKTALLTGAHDKRFFLAYSNDSGCSGAALARGTRGENVERITSVFPYWFCENYSKYADRHDDMPFDQHFLIAAIAPNKAYVASAAEDLWADPFSEYLSCACGGEFYELFGIKGFVGCDRKPQPGDRFHDGNVAYHLRDGVHYFSREDWNILLDYVLK